MGNQAERIVYKKLGQGVDKNGRPCVEVEFARACDLSVPDLSKEQVYFATYKKPIEGGGLATSHSYFINEGLFNNLDQLANKDGDAKGKWDGVINAQTFESSRNGYGKSASNKTFTKQVRVIYPDLRDESVQKGLVTTPVEPFNEQQHNKNYHDAIVLSKRNRKTPSVSAPATDKQNEPDVGE